MKENEKGEGIWGGGGFWGKDMKQLWERRDGMGSTFKLSNLEEKWGRGAISMMLFQSSLL